MGIDKIVVRGARQHNLKNIHVEIPRNRLTVITGLSGSGKSSLAFDTIYAEGQRRYVESLSAYARQFLDQLERPDVDSIEGLSPAISIEQKTTSRSPRSTVGTITEIYDYLRLLYSSIGVPHCYKCGRLIARQSTRQILEHLRALPEGERVMVLAPIVRGRKGEFKKQLEDLSRDGFVRARIDGNLHSLDEKIRLDKQKNHTIEVVVDRLMIKPGMEKRLESSIDVAMKLTKGIVLVAIVGGDERLYSEKLACVDCGISIPAVEPRTFSFNSHYGACPECSGLGYKFELDPGRVVPNPSKSILNGGLAPWSDELPSEISEFLNGIRDHFKVDLNQPFESLPSKVQSAIWNGVNHVPNLEDGILRRMQESYASGFDEEQNLETFMVSKACSACDGRRLRAESLAIQVAGLSIAELTALSVGETLRVVRDIQLTEREKAIAGRIVHEVIETVGIPGGGRTELPEPVSLRSHAVRRRGPAHSAGDADWFQVARCLVCAR